MYRLLDQHLIKSETLSLYKKIILKGKKLIDNIYGLLLIVTLQIIVNVHSNIESKFPYIYKYIIKKIVLLYDFLKICILEYVPYSK